MECCSRFTDLINSLPVGVVCFNASGGVAFCNHRFTELFPRTRDDCRAGTNIVDVINAAINCGETAERLRSFITLLKDANGESSCIAEAIMHRLPDGRVFEFRARRTAEGGIVLFCSDITRTQKAAEAGDYSRQQFISVVSHELRTPLSIILGAFQLIEARSGSADIERLVASGQRAAENLLEMIDEILDFAHTEAESLKTELSPFDLGRLLGDVRNKIVMPDRTGVDVGINVDQALLSSAFVGDAKRLKQVLVNLLRNAVKFGEGESILFCVDCIGGPVEKPLLEFSVTDAGIGMEAESQARLFQPFTQLEMSNSRRYGGVGLGLAVSQKLVTLMGGEPICVDSQFGVGSRFSFRLPLARYTEGDLSLKNSSR